MKIDLTRKEYRDLLDILFVANWVLNAYRVGEDPRTVRYGKLEQKLLALAKQMDYENLVQYVPEHNRYYPTREYEETSSTQTFIIEYENDSFWEELTSRLAERDLARQLGGFDRVVALSPEELFEKLGQLEKFYDEEFSHNGLENLQLRDQKWLSQPGKTVH